MALVEKIKTEIIVNGEEKMVDGIEVNIQDVERIVLVNLTPHELNIHIPEMLIDDFLRPGGWDEVIKEFIMNVPPSGIITRIVEKTEISTRCPSYLVQTRAIRFSGLKDLPDPKPNTIFVTSRIVGEKTKTRKDVFFPGELIRDTDGKIIACEGLAYFE